MGSKWKKLKMLVSKRICIISSLDPADLPHGSGEGSHNGAEAACSSVRPIAKNTSGIRRGASSEPIIINTSEAICTQSAPTTPIPSYSGPVSASAEGRNSGVGLSRSTCSICLEMMKPGHGQAFFMAECSHTFHFSCIVSNVRYGNQVCPICRAKWKDVPWQAGVRASKSQRGRSGSHRTAPSAVPRSLTDNGRLNLFNGSEDARRRHNLSLQLFNEGIPDGLIYPEEPDLYNDDEPVTQSVSSDASTLQENRISSGGSHDEKVLIKAYSEISAVPACESRLSFTVLIHLKAPPSGTGANERSGMEAATPSSPLFQPSSRAPLDLVAVLDISGSMAGRKLALLKQAMGFVVHNLSSADRLSVVVFSSGAKRIFPLRKMGEEGQRQSLQAIDALIATGGTNIAEGLRKGVKVLEDCKERNPVSSIMLLSDGQDTYSMSSQRQLPFFLSRGMTDSRRLVPRSIRRSASLGRMQIPVHTFGFGSDHDAATMHTISEVSGGTFSFIQAEDMVQDAFAQCIGGLLSVVIQDVQLTVSCSAPGVLINRIHAGSYNSSILDSARHGIVKLGDLYAEEERDVLVDLKLPVVTQSQGAVSMSLVQAGCIYKDPVTQVINQKVADELCIVRPLALEEGQQVISLEVDRQRNRLRTTEAIAEARSLADQGNIEAAQCGLQSARTQLGNSPSARAGDQLCNVLESELSQIQERMANQQLYERSGRAYLLSAQSSHLRQRATTRGDSLDGLLHDYQTPSMVDMITLSQTMLPSELIAPGAFPFGSRSSTNQGSNVTVPSHSSGRSLLRRVTDKVRRSHGSV